jgi:hypothetical protein
LLFDQASVLLRANMHLGNLKDTPFAPFIYYRTQIVRTLPAI